VEVVAVFAREAALFDDSRPFADSHHAVHAKPKVGKGIDLGARKKNVTVGMVVNDCLRKDIRSRERASKQKLR
jgi:hypothetical protein